MALNKLTANMTEQEARATQNQNNLHLLVSGATIDEQTIFDELAKKTSESSGADLIGVSPIDGIEGDNAQAVLTALSTELTDIRVDFNSYINDGIYYEESKENLLYDGGYFDQNGIFHSNSYNVFYETKALDCYDTKYIVLEDYPAGSGFETITFFKSPFCRSNERISGVVNPSNGVITVPHGALGYKVQSNINNPLKTTKILQVRKAYDYEKHFIFVSNSEGVNDCDGTSMKPYKTIYDANQSINDNAVDNRYYIIVDSGTYTDLQERYSGDMSTSGYQGVVCKDYVYYYAYNQLQATGNTMPLATINWDGATGLGASDVTNTRTGLKCPFHIVNNVHTEIKGFIIDGKNLRYGMHIETAGNGGVSEWLIENCHITYRGNPDTVDWADKWLKPVIGVGTTFGEKGVIRNCKITNADAGHENNGWIMQTHDNATNPGLFVKCGAEYLLENCVLTPKGTISSTFAMRSGTTTAYDTPNHLKIKKCTDTSIHKSIHVTQDNGGYWRFTFEATDGVIDN